VDEAEAVGQWLIDADAPNLNDVVEKPIDRPSWSYLPRE
jgi:hypothetical protein